ncbi:MAG: response regulator [Deferrisomatales bacterium]
METGHGAPPNAGLTGRPYVETVLVVDDTEFMVKVLEEIFDSDGYRVCTAKSGQEAIQRYNEELPDLVTLDVVMPGLDGIATLRMLRQLDPAARVVMVSAVGLEAKVMEAIRSGARNYLLKPFEKDKVLEVARKVLDEY